MCLGLAALELGLGLGVRLGGVGVPLGEIVRDDFLAAAGGVGLGQLRARKTTSAE